MILLDDIQTWVNRARTDDLSALLTESDRHFICALSDEQLESRIRKFFSSPVEKDPLTGDYGAIYRWFFASKWKDALLAIQPDAPMKLYEVAPGANDIIPKTVAGLYTHDETAYITSNVDKTLTEKFRKKTGDLPIRIEIIEDIAQNIESSIDKPYFDTVVFEHSVNDVLYAILPENLD